jgi:DNA-binding transcriptional regulator LsrR (DeoR family)
MTSVSVEENVTEDERLEYLGQIAAWYYEDDLDQVQIGRRIGKSRSMVSRLLREARDEGLVQFRVRYPLRRDALLENELERTFGLDNARVLSETQDLGYDGMMRRLGRLASRALERRLHSRMRVTVGWGAALHHVTRAMPEIQLDDVMVLQGMGSVGDGDPAIDGADLARRLASRLNGDFRSLSAPLFVDREGTAKSLLADRTIAATLAMARSAEVAVTGIGSIDSSLSGLRRAGYFKPSELEELREQGVVGDLMGYLMDEAGSVLDIPQNRKVVALRPEELATVETVVGVAGGASKSAAILAALRGGYLDVLVTDAAAAEAILALNHAPNDLSGVT